MTNDNPGGATIAGATVALELRSEGTEPSGQSGPSVQTASAAQELTWVLAARTGDRAAFGKLAQLYQRQCAAVAVRLLGNAHDAAELVQDALLKAYRSLEQLNQSERFGPWLMRIVTNLALNFRRSRVRKQAISLERTASEEGEDLRTTLAGDAQDAPDKPLTSAELGEAIQRSIDALPQKQRLALGDVRD